MVDAVGCLYHGVRVSETAEPKVVMQTDHSSNAAPNLNFCCWERGRLRKVAVYFHRN